MAGPAVTSVIRGRVLGAAFLALLVLFVWLTYAVYSKKFVDVVPVELRTSNIGLNLPRGADVKIRGMIVGEVREAEPTRDGATLHLALDPDKVSEVPSDVTALIVPKTLFGEKYIALQVPENPSTTPIAEGDVIERASVPIEVEKLLADATPLLETVPPEELAYTLNALSTALEGRGERIGDNLVRLDSYLKKMNPLVPTLVEDLRSFGEVSDLYASVMPEIGATLKNTSTTGRTVVNKADEITALYDDVTLLSATTRSFLAVNGENLIELGRVSIPTLEVLAQFSPEFPCLMNGMADWIPTAAEAFRGYTLHINLETLPNQPTGYGPPDMPEFDVDGLGPVCATLPADPYDQGNPAPPPPRSMYERGGVEGRHNKFRVTPAALARAQQLVHGTGRMPDLATLFIGPMTLGAGEGSK